jgi:hypothetical protein
MRSFASVICTTSRARDPRLHPRRALVATWRPSRESFACPRGPTSLSSHERLGTFRSFAGGARRRCVPTSHVTAWAAGRRRVTQRLSSSFRETVGCGDIRRASVITLLDRRALSSEQPREGLPAPRARGAIHRVTEPDFRLGWRGFDLSRGRGRRCSDRVPCPSAWGCLCYREDRSSERDVPVSSARVVRTSVLQSPAATPLPPRLLAATVGSTRLQRCEACGL